MGHYLENYRIDHGDRVSREQDIYTGYTIAVLENAISWVKSSLKETWEGELLNYSTIINNGLLYLIVRNREQYDMKGII